MTFNGVAMQRADDLLQPLVGCIAWGVDRGHGSFLRMEFGAPHLVVRDPIAPRHATSSKARHALSRRRVHIIGDWSFWVQDGDWVLRASTGTLDSTDLPGSPLDEALRDLDGQRLLSIAPGSEPNSIVLTFDLGAILMIQPSTQTRESQWSLHVWQGPIVTFEHDGSVSSERLPGK
jgi:hypothetical protein